MKEKEIKEEKSFKKTMTSKAIEANRKNARKLAIINEFGKYLFELLATSI